MHPSTVDTSWNNLGIQGNLECSGFIHTCSINQSFDFIFCFTVRFIVLNPLDEGKKRTNLFEKKNT